MNNVVRIFSKDSVLIETLNENFKKKCELIFYAKVEEFETFDVSFFLGIDLDGFSESESLTIINAVPQNIKFNLFFFASNPTNETMDFVVAQKAFTLIRKPLLISEFHLHIFQKLNNEKDIQGEPYQLKIYSHLMQYSPCGIIVMQDDKIIFSNSRFWEIIESPQQEDYSLSLWDRMDNIRFREDNYQFNHKKFESELTTYKQKKIVVDVDEITSEFNGEKIKIFLLQDVTKFKNSENELFEKQKYLNMILQEIPVAILLVDEDTQKITDLNVKFVEMSKYSTHDIIGKKLSNFIKNEDNESDSLSAYEATLISSSGEDISVKISQVPTEMDKKIFSLIIISDNSLQKIMENNRRNYERLQGILELAGTINHELNQPLQIIQGQTELLMMTTPEDNKNFKKINKIYEQVERTGEITKKISSITNYETYDYVGNQRILDLDKASKTKDKNI